MIVIVVINSSNNSSNSSFAKALESTAIFRSAKGRFSVAAGSRHCRKALSDMKAMRTNTMDPNTIGSMYLPRNARS